MLMNLILELDLISLRQASKKSIAITIILMVLILVGAMQNKIMTRKMMTLSSISEENHRKNKRKNYLRKSQLLLKVTCWIYWVVSTWTLDHSHNHQLMLTKTKMLLTFSIMIMEVEHSEMLQMQMLKINHKLLIMIHSILMLLQIRCHNNQRNLKSQKDLSQIQVFKWAQMVDLRSHNNNNSVQLW